ncbi:MAG: hypothetical protein K8R74_18040 [Bacteroidales bacterium]|nr:hypothetical protein [Bacteroidales bacterium]
MSETAHKIFIIILSVIVSLTLLILSYIGFTYYNTALEERFYHTDHTWLKPSGGLGHGLGIFGSLLMIIGVSSYMIRKRFRSLSRFGQLKHWLEFHIFLCTLGPIMVLFHTSFKFGGIVAISFWSMVAVFLSGIIGRFIYIQIPRTIEGRELNLNEVKELKSDIGEIITNVYHLDKESQDIIVESTKKKVELYHANFLVRYFKKYRDNKKSVKQIKTILKKNNLSRIEKRDMMKLVKNEISLNRKIERLQTMQNLFKYWHVAHLPFALVMLVIMIIHVVVTMVFGYKWIF